MKTKIKTKSLKTFALTAVLGLGICGTATAQHMFLVTPKTQGSLNDPITFDIVVDGNIGAAVAWGTTSSFSDTNMTYNMGYTQSGLPYRSLQPFFDTDFTDTSAIGDGHISFNFINTMPGANFGSNGYTELAEFQILLNPSTPVGIDLTVGLSALGIPPSGTAVQDDSGNNLLLPIDPLNSADSVSTSHLYITGGLRPSWIIGTPTAVPEANGVLALLLGVAGGGRMFLRRRRA